MLTKQLQALIEVSLANGQSYDEIRGMLAMQDFSDSEITGLFDEYDAKMKGEKPVEEQYLGITKPAQQPDVAPTSQTASAAPTTPTPPAQTEPASQPGMVLDLDASDDAISFVEEEADEQAEYNLKTPSYLDKEAYEKNAQSASMVAKTIAQPAEKEIVDIDKDMQDEVPVVPPTPVAQPEPAVSPAPTSVLPTAPPIVASAPQQEQEVAYATPAVPVQNNVPQQAHPLTTHAAAQSQQPTENMTQFTSTLSTSCVGSDFTGSAAPVDVAAMQTKTSTPPQVAVTPAPQQMVPPAPANAGIAPSSIPPAQNTPYQPAQGVQVGLGNIPELTAASNFAQQQAKGKSPAPVIIILVIVLGVIFGFMYWYYFMSDLRTSIDEPEVAPVSEPAPLDPLQVDPFTGQLVE